MMRRPAGHWTTGALLWRCLTLTALLLLVAVWTSLDGLQAPSTEQQQRRRRAPAAQGAAAGAAANGTHYRADGAQDESALEPHANLTQLRAAAPTFPRASMWRTAQAAACLRRAFASPRPPDSRVYSQWGEDGILEAIYACIGVTTRTYVEFGTESGVECTTRWLREAHGFTGLLMDGGHQNAEINLRKELITAENIDQLLRKHQVSTPLDHMTVDLDFNTWHVAAAVLAAGWRPRSLCIEFNRDFLPHQSYVVPYHPTTAWIGDMGCHFGASALATDRLARAHGYRLVAVDQLGVNLFFVHASALGVLWAPELHPPTSQYHPLRQVWPKLHGPCQGKQWVQVLGGGGERQAAPVVLGDTVTLYHKDRDEEDRVRLFFPSQRPASNTNVTANDTVPVPLPDYHAGTETEAAYVARYWQPSRTGAILPANCAMHQDEDINEFAHFIRANAGRPFSRWTVPNETLRWGVGTRRASRAASASL